MHDYKLTGRIDTDRCLKLANEAHSFYFKDPMRYSNEFVKSSLDFFDEVERKYRILLCRKEGRVYNEEIKEKFSDVLEKFYGDNENIKKYIATELRYIKNRLDIIVKQPNVINKDTKFVLDHTARFIEIILPYISSVKKEVEQNKKFTFKGIADKEFDFFSLKRSNEVKNPTLKAFYNTSWRSQKLLNGFAFMQDYLDLNNSVVNEFYLNYGGFDMFSSLIFARMANEQMLKYLSEQMGRKFDTFLDKQVQERLQNSRYRDIKIPERIDVLRKAGIFNRLIANESKLINQRGNNNAHEGISGMYSSCYHSLEFLNYLNKHCR